MMFNWFIKFIWESPLGAVIYNIWEYFDTKREKKARSALLIAKTRTVQVVNRSMLGEAITRLKRGLKAAYDINKLKTGEIKEIEIHSFAEGDRAELAKTLIKAYVYHEKDIKTQSDEERMIYKRMNHYKELQQNVLQRRLIREIRRETSETRKAELIKEFEAKLKEKK
jgi:hypothetical protein